MADTKKLINGYNDSILSEAEVENAIIANFIKRLHESLYYGNSVTLTTFVSPGQNIKINCNIYFNEDGFIDVILGDKWG